MMMIDTTRSLASYAHRDALRVLVLIVSAIGVWTPALRAQVPVETGSSEPAWTPGPEAEAAVRRDFAALWGMEDQDILIEWGTLPRGRKVESGPTRLAGSGNGGAWIAYFEGTSGSDFGIQVRIGFLATTWTATHRLPRGTVIAPEHMTQVESVRWGAPGQEDPAVKEGWVTVRVITAGEKLTSPAVAPPIIVAAGAPVEVVWQTPSLRLTTRGTAVRRGRLGDLIGVRLESRRTVRGVVTGPGLVQIGGGSR